MSTGLPVFATCFGGPLEIIEDGVSGFHIDPNRGDVAADRMAEFLKTCREDPSRWEAIARGALDRVAERYTWTRYAERLMTLATVQGFRRNKRARQLQKKQKQERRAADEEAIRGFHMGLDDQ